MIERLKEYMKADGFVEVDGKCLDSLELGIKLAKKEVKTTMTKMALAALNLQKKLIRI